MGQGDCTFFVPPAGEGDPILFDCADLYVAERFVANHRFGRLEAAVASHLDIDHVRGMLPFLLGHFGGRELGRLVIGLDRAPEMKKDKNLKALVKQAIAWENAPPCPGFLYTDPVRDLEGPLRIAAGAGWAVDLVLPFKGTRDEALLTRSPNLASAVIRVSRGDAEVYVGGDAPLGSWERLDLVARVGRRAVRVSHHGGDIREGGDRWRDFPDLYDALQAEDALLSVGTNNNFRGVTHPLPEHVTAARRAGACRVLCTQLTRRCHPNPVSVRAAALAGARSVEPAYRHEAVAGFPEARPADEVPCAGSMVVWIEADGSIQVEPRPGGAHERLLARLATPMCV